MSDDRRSFPFRISERRVLFGIADVLFLNMALLFAMSLRRAHSLSLSLISGHVTWFMVVTVLWFPIAYAFDAYEPFVMSRPGRSALAVAKAGAVTAGIYLLIPYVTPAFPSARRFFFAVILIVPVSLALERLASATLFSRGGFRQRVLVVGAGWAGRTVVEAIQKFGRGMYEVVGFVDDDPSKVNSVIEVGGKGIEVVGDHTALKDVIQERGVSTLVLSVTRGVSASTLQALIDTLELGIEVVPMSVMFEELTGRVPIEHVGDNWYVSLPINHPGTKPFNKMLKRASDVFLASLGVFVMLPFFPFLALAIYIDSPGPIFYTQVRVGKGGKLFKAYKFRSMIPDAEKEGKPVWARERDPRVTRVGRILRKTHVDEFPQFLNILKGEMSAVGPRPERPEFVEELAEEIPFYRLRHAVKPGMAGWGLVKQGYGASKEDAFMKLQYDLYYIKHQSLWLDLVILLKTVMDTLTLGGR